MGKVIFDEELPQIMLARGQSKTLPLIPSLFQRRWYYDAERIKRWKKVFTMSTMKGIISRENS